jgi:acetyl esterase/lipase
MSSLGLNKKVTLHNLRIPTRDGFTLEARTHRHIDVGTSKALPVYIHLHGGGFLFGSVSSENSSCSRIVATLAEKDTPIVVINVDYRHTPEHKYPVAWNDTEDACHWIHENLQLPGITGDPEKVILGGISAGVWLTSSTALAHDIGKDKTLATRSKIKGQGLMIPALVHYD